MVILRELSRNDVVFVNKWRHDRTVSDMLGGAFRYLDLELDEQWFEDYLKNRDNQVRCAISIDDRQEPVGVVYLLNIDQVNRSAEFAIMIGNTDYQGRGIGTSATQRMLEHAFLNLNLKRVYLTVLTDNQAAIKLYQKVGFIEEGTLREAVFKNGQYKNMLMMSMLRDEFDLALDADRSIQS